MTFLRYWTPLVCLGGVLLLPCPAQQPPQPSPPPKADPAFVLPAAPDPKLKAASVNGQEISEVDVFRPLMRYHPSEHESVRGEVLQFLIENVLIDQYLESQKIPVADKEID